LKVYNTKYMHGKIIAITGGPRTGKSTLTKLLSAKLNATAFLEGEEKDFPPRIWENIKTNHRLLELLIWFRNKCVKDYLEAMEIKKNGGIAILDSFWATNDVYVERWMSDQLEIDLMKAISKIDYAVLPWPDLVISLYSNKNKIKEFAIAGEREFELTEEFLKKQIDLNNAHEDYFRKINKPNVKFIDRSNFDFFNQKTVDTLIKEIFS
jgi:deoxyadenosine/deoxycytidine kinase